MSYLYGTEDTSTPPAAPSPGALLASSLINAGIGVGSQTAQSILTGKSAVKYDPKSGLPLDPGTGAIIDPATGWPATPQVIQAATRAKLIDDNSILGVVIVLGLIGAVFMGLRR